MKTCYFHRNKSNDATVFGGCNPFLTTARIEIERASNCNSSISGTKLTQTVPYASSYNLRTLFPTYTSTADLYRITYSVQGITGLLVGPTHCVRVNSLDASNAEFLLKAPNNGMPLNRTTTDPTAANQAVGDFTAGLYLTNTTSLVNSLDYYNVQIWLTSGGNNVTQILDSGKICLDQNSDPNDGCINYPIGYDFNPPTSLYFYGLSTTDKQNNRYRVRLTVHNQCGESYQESYFRVEPTCHGCLTAGGGGQGTLQEDGQAEDRQSKIENLTDVSVKVHPNPTDGALYVAAVLSQEGIANFTLYNDGGQEVASFQQDMIGTFLNLNQSLNIESLPVGIYWWRFIANGQVRTGKVVKN